VAPSPLAGQPAPAFPNPDFESGQQGWVAGADIINDNPGEPARNGSFKAWLGGSLLAAKLAAGVSKKYASNMRQVLHAVFEDAGADEIITTNPVAFHGKDRMKLSTTKAERQSKVKALDSEQLGAFMATCAKRLPDRLVLFRTLALTGLRIGEALGLRWDDIDWKKREARIARSYTSSRLELPKGGLVASVDLSKGLVEDLREWQRRAKAKALERGYKLAPWVFPALRHPKLMTDANDVADDFKRVPEAAELPGHFTPHSLRHTFATQHLQNGTSVYYVQRQLRHSSIQITVDTYGSSLPAGNVEHADALERRFLGEDPVTHSSPIEASPGHSAVRSHKG